MASITFGGLASGLDTDSIISALMEVEKQPLTRLENDRSYLNSRLSAFSDFETKLEALNTAFKDLDSTDKFRSYSATAASDEFYSVQTTSTAKAGNYSIEVVSLAQVQKSASVGYASTTESLFSAGTIDINGTGITVDTDDTLGDIVDKINAANTGDAATGVSAALINDGTTNGYRIALTGKDASTTFTASATGVSADGQALSFTTTKNAQQAEVHIDGLTIVSSNNTIKGAIPGVELSLLKENETDQATQLNVDIDTEGVKAKLDSFVSAYNEIINFISEQKDTSWYNDSGMQSVKRKLQSMLTENTGGSGSLQNLIDIGISTDEKDGTISLNSTKINTLINEDFEDLEKLFLGEDGISGINDKFSNYLDLMTDSLDGLYASKKKSTDSALKSLDRNIEYVELRLEKREASLRSQFESLELLMSSMNATSTYLTQQISNMNSSNNG